MIAVVGGAGMIVRIKVTPQEEPEHRPTIGDTLDYNTLNVAVRAASGDDITMEGGGCGFNIASHLAEMGHEVAFASIVGDDAPGLAVISQLQRLGIDSSYVKTEEGTTPVKVELLNVLNDPQMAFGNDELYKRMTTEVAEEWTELLDKASAIVLDGNLPQDTLEYIISRYGQREDMKIFFDPADYLGAVKVRNVMDRLYCIMPGRVEAEAMAGRTVLSEEQLMEAGKFFEDSGVAKTIITIKGGGLYYKDGLREGILRPERILSFAGTSGAGDVASAAIIAADMEGKDIEEMTERAMKKAAEFLAGRSDERFVDIVNAKKNDKQNNNMN